VKAASPSPHRDVRWLPRTGRGAQDRCSLTPSMQPLDDLSSHGVWWSRKNLHSVQEKQKAFSTL
jgi:hypothetical protein